MAVLNASGPTLPGAQVYRHRDTRFWAEHGMVALVREDTGEFKYLSPSEAAERAVAFIRDAKRMRATGWKYADEKQAQATLAVNLMDCAKQAYAQGGPTEPEVIEREKQASARLFMMTGVQPGQLSSGPKKLYVPGES